MERIERALRRKHSTELRSQVLGECAQPGASVAAVAMAHGLNANLVRKWRHKATGDSVPAALTRVNKSSGEFVALALSPQSAEVSSGDIRIELRRGATAMSIHWPVQCSAECAAWLRECKLWSAGETPPRRHAPGLHDHAVARNGPVFVPAPQSSPPTQ